MAVDRSAPTQPADAAPPTRIIGGAFCIVEGGQVVRATLLGRTADLNEYWAAGRGSWRRRFADQRPYWPVHYAGAGPRLRLVDASS